MISPEERGGDHLQILNKSLEVGIDEVGRGSIFGPVFSSVVVLTRQNSILLKKLGVDDSKKLTKNKREELFPKILAFASEWALGQSSVREIDTFGIRHATELSMIRALKKLNSQPSNLIVDGSLKISIWEGNQTNEINGESKFVSVAAASILAKVQRDFLMIRLGQKYQEYFLESNKGYGTKQHFESIKHYGVTMLHRKTFLKKIKPN